MSSSKCEEFVNISDDSLEATGLVPVVFTVRWSLVRRDHDGNGDALTLARWIDLEVDERYVVDPEQASAGERHRAYVQAMQAASTKLTAALDLLAKAESALDTEGALSEDFKASLHWLRGVVK